MLKKQISTALFHNKLNSNLFLVIAPVALYSDCRTLFPNAFSGLKHVMMKFSKFKLTTSKFDLCYFFFNTKFDLLKCLTKFQYKLVSINYYSFYFSNELSSFVSDFLLFDIKVFLNKLKSICFTYLQHFSFFLKKFI